MKKTFLTILLSTLMLTAFAQHHDRDHGHGHYHGPQAPRPTEQYIQPATPYQMSVIMQYIKDINFSADKTKAAVLCVTLCAVPTNDLIEIINLFSFDDSKVEVLKAAYFLCPDKQHFYKAIEQLTFTSSKEEVYRFLEAID